MNGSKNIIYADFGNSAAKFLTHNGLFRRLSYENNEIAKFLQQETPLIIVYSSVHAKAIEQLKHATNAKQIEAYRLLHETDFLDFGETEGMGADRLFGLAGALSQAPPPVVTIDCGTAITVNILNENRKVLGGIILPGYKLQEYALRTGTEGLKNINIKPPVKLIGRNTDEAISAGIYFGTAAAVENFLKSIEQDVFTRTSNIFFDRWQFLVNFALPAEIV